MVLGALQQSKQAPSSGWGSLCTLGGWIPHKLGRVAQNGCNAVCGSTTRKPGFQDSTEKYFA